MTGPSSTSSWIDDPDGLHQAVVADVTIGGIIDGSDTTDGEWSLDFATARPTFYIADSNLSVCNRLNVFDDGAGSLAWRPATTRLRYDQFALWNPVGGALCSRQRNDLAPCSSLVGTWKSDSASTKTVR